jgi:uncharacterized membrane protein YqjE
MRNRWILFGYLSLFFVVVGLYDSYKDNDLLVVIAAAALLITGLLAWIWSVQPKNPDQN